MKVVDLFEAPNMGNMNSRSVGYDSRGDYPQEWNQDDSFNPEDEGFEPFKEVWNDIEQRLTTGDTLKGIAQIMGVSAKEVYNEFRKAKRYAVQAAKQEITGGDLNDAFYDEHATNIFHVLTHADSARWEEKNGTMRKHGIRQMRHKADYVTKALALLADSRHIHDYESARQAKEDDFKKNY